MEPNRDAAIAKTYGHNIIRHLVSEVDDFDDVDHLCCRACRVIKFTERWSIEQWESPKAM